MGAPGPVLRQTGGDRPGGFPGDLIRSMEFNKEVFMKRTISLLVIFLFALSAVPLTFAERAAPANKVITLQISGMAPGASSKAEAIIRQLPGVAQVKASEEMGAMVIIYDPLKVKTEEFTAAMRQAGYLASFAKANYSCPKCKATYHRNGRCLICDVPLEEIKKG